MWIGPMLQFLSSINLQKVDQNNMASNLEDTPNVRSTRLQLMRASLKKQLPILNQKTTLLNKKLENLKKQIEPLPTDTLDQTSSVSGDSSYSQVYCIVNSFLDKYDLLEKLGEGGNACVYKCMYKKNGKIYAVKKFQTQEEHLSNLRKNFISLKGLNHPSIIKYRALHFDRRNAYLVMQYIGSPNLTEYKIKSQEQLKTIIRQIGGAVKYIHDRNICHRDIKPENILYNSETRKIKLIDFQIAKKTFQRGARRDMLTIIGTHYYLAPEIYLGGGYDERVDLWAIGITIYKLIAGYTPFQSEYHSDTISNILQGKVSFDDQTWNKYGVFAKDFVSRFLKKKEERMTITDAGKHLYIAGKHLGKLARYSSHYMELNEVFHNEMKNQVSNSLSREEGGNQSGLALFKNVKLMGLSEFSLEDSEDQQRVLPLGNWQKSENTNLKLRHKSVSLCARAYTEI